MVRKGVQEGSIMGTFLYNAFSNGLLLKMQRLNTCNILNYGDDNTIFNTIVLR